MVYEDDYEVYEDGRFYSKKVDKFTGTTNAYGYTVVCVHGIQVLLHRIVATCFIPNPDNKPMVNHKDGNKKNNRVDNLEWVTNAENMKHGWKTGLMKRGELHGASRYTDEQIHWVCQQLQDGMSCARIVDDAEFTINRNRVLGIRARRDWKHISKDYTWKYYKEKRATTIPKGSRVKQPEAVSTS